MTKQLEKTRREKKTDRRKNRRQKRKSARERKAQGIDRRKGRTDWVPNQGKKQVSKKTKSYKIKKAKKMKINS